MITQSQAKELFDYNDGNLIRKTSASNRVKIGDVAGCIDSIGYIRVGVLNKTYLNHRIIFMMHHGYIPKEIDHIDGNPSNNKIENLRVCTNTENQYNAKLSKRNTSGAKGVVRDKKQNLWRARFVYEGKAIHIGRYINKDDAIKAVKAKRIELHGEFCNHGVAP